MTNTSKLLIPALAFTMAACSGDARSANKDTADSTEVAQAPDSAVQAGPTLRKAPAVIRGIYLNAYAAGSTKRLGTLLALADSTEINTFVVDVKDEKGMRYRTELPLQKEIGGEVTISNLKALVDSLHAHKVWASARIVVFKDPMLSVAKSEWSIKNPSGGLWQDKAGNTWVSAWDRDVWDYNSLVDTRTVDTHMRRLREKLGEAAKYLDTVRGVGYRFVDNN